MGSATTDTEQSSLAVHPMSFSTSFRIFCPTFIGGRSPQITVHCGDETRHYPAEINSIVYRRSEPIELNTKDFGTLTLTLMECDKVASADLNGSHFVHFIAHDRTVHSQRIDGRLGLKYFGDEEN